MKVVMAIHGQDIIPIAKTYMPINLTSFPVPKGIQKFKWQVSYRNWYYANNFFGIKKWGQDEKNSYQLVGQPDEDEGNVRIIERLQNGQLIFEEVSRKDNRYRIFENKAECINFLVEKMILEKNRYRPVIESYRQRLISGITSKEASRLFLKELADAGYCHLGGDYYMTTIGKVIDEKNLDILDQ